MRKSSRSSESNAVQRNRWGDKGHGAFRLWVVLCPLSLTLWAGPRDALWKNVDDAVRQGLPKSAITNLEPIFAGALKDKAYAEAVKAMGKKIALEGTIEGNKPEEKITRLEAEMAKAPKEMAPVLETLLAHWYWHYFQQNRFRFMQRTTTTQAPGKDFTTWDLRRIFAEIDKHFQGALAAEKILQTTPINTWDDLLQKGSMPDNLRPTLYDFIAHEALTFYTSAEQAGARPEAAFELSSDSPILDAAPRFLSWSTPGPGTLAEQQQDATLRAIRLYQQLMRFHQNDAPPRLAFADLDLERLSWGGNAAFGENKNARYRAALEAFIREYGDFELSALAREREARLVQAEGDFVGAHRLAQRGVELFPQSPGGRLCRNLLLELEAKSCGITTERIWLPRQEPAAPDARGSATTNLLTVRYRNIDAVYFRAVPVDWELFLQKRYHRPENLSEQERREILAKSPALQWSEKLPPTPDFKEKSFITPAPSQLKPGYYFIVSSHDANFGERQNEISMADVWVTDLALVTRTRERNLEGFVLDGYSGEPLSGAVVATWYLDNQGNRVAEPSVTTDEQGFFSVKGSANRNYVCRVRYQGREIATAGDLWLWGAEPVERPEMQTVLFTDRALYRPGQTIQYKGICLRVDQVRDNYEVLKGETVTVVFRDPNGKEISRSKHFANDFGSFSGSCTAPRDRLMGSMTLRVEGRAHGQTGIRVEEYKRPKFQVTLDPPRAAAKLNEKVSLDGHALGYTGAAIDGAQVHYHVVREARMPRWWGWWHVSGMGGEQAQEIAHGTVRTTSDGSFKIEFIARPDPKLAEKDEPTFSFAINADVTDDAGETRSAERNLRAGYSALEATLSAEEWQTEDTPVSLSIETKSLDGDGQVAEGSLKVYELVPPTQVQRPPVSGGIYQPYQGRFPMANEPDLSQPINWPLGKVVAEAGFTTATNGTAKASFKLAAGAYRAVLETQDRFGKKVSFRLPLQVLKPEAANLALRIPHLLAAPNWEVEPGQEFMALWGTGYASGRAFVEIEHRRRLLRRFWTKPGQTQEQIKVAVTEAMRGGFVVHVTHVRENRAYLESRKVNVPWRNKELALKWEHFTSKLQPGQQESWSCVVSKVRDENATKSPSTNSPERFAAEMVAALYDESLDAFQGHAWMEHFGVFREDVSSLQSQFANTAIGFLHVFGDWGGPGYQDVQVTYRSFPPELTVNLWGYMYFRRGYSAAMSGGGVMRGVAPMPMAAPPAEAEDAMREGAVTQLAANRAAVALDKVKSDVPARTSPAPATPKPDLNLVSARKNLNETAFFFPQLTSDTNGIVRMTFTMPEALTRWRFMGFAHDRQLRSGYLEAHAVTAKDLMVQPNPPRFLREGDIIEFTVKVSNQSEQSLSGQVRLTFNFARDNQPADQLLGNRKTEQAFVLAPKQSRAFSWRITVPDGCGFLTYKAVGATSSVSDGEEGAIPVLSRRILVTESLPLPIRGPATKKFEFGKLLKSAGSKSLQNQSLTVQMVSQPAWYAVLALPYLMEFPHECTEQTFNRLYANALARTIANRDPKVSRIFDQWKNTAALDSPLEKNQELKAVALEETPWLRQAQNESQARRNVGVLFDDNRLNYELAANLEKLKQMQLSDGSWPWFPGGRGNDYITLYITTGFGRLRHLGVDLDTSPAIRSLRRLDAWMSEEFERIQRAPNPERYVPSATDALYLYGRSFFLKDLPFASAHKLAIDFFLNQARKFWLETNCRQTQGQLALALQRFSAFSSTADGTPASIMKSIKERSVSSEEMGMFWRDTELSWWWYHAPIETQALMIEAFDEIMNDQAAVEECRVWLLKQKQTQDWKTTKATADAVYALLLRGSNLLSSDALVELKLDGIDVTPRPGSNQRQTKQGESRSPVEPGTGFYEVRFEAGEIKPALGAITVRKMDSGVAWGSVHWQYLEDISKITPYEGTPLKLKKALFIKSASPRGPVLEAVKGPVVVGDELVVRLDLRVDRDMEYVHLKDQRGSGTEPVNVLSAYHYQDGLGYYESTRDTASHFFIDYLPKGNYVFEYSTRVQLRGEYQTGMAEIQCMYAPEFNSHSESLGLRVK